VIGSKLKDKAKDDEQKAKLEEILAAQRPIEPQDLESEERLVAYLREHLQLDRFPPHFLQDTQVVVTAYFAEQAEIRDEARYQMLMGQFGPVTIDQVSLRLHGALSGISTKNKALKQALNDDFGAVYHRRRGNLTKEIGALNELLATTLKLDLPSSIYESSEDPSQTFRLNYAERLVPRLIGRDDQLAELHKFRDEKPDSGPDFRWWLVWGEGGAGKSRLALEWLLASPSPWVGGFLADHLPSADDIRRWTPACPTLLVVDYAQTRAGAVHEMLRALEEKTDLKHPVRVLLLERNAGGWVSDTVIGGDLTVFETQRPVGESRWREPLGLPPLSVDDFTDLFELALVNLGAPRPTAADVQRAKQYFGSAEFSRRRLRPLYAGLSAYAAATSPNGIDDVLKWPAHALEEYVLAHELTIWRNHLRPTVPDFLLAEAATSIGGLSADQVDRINHFFPPARCPDLQTANPATARAINSHSELDEEGVPPLEPDPIGEAFLAARLRGKLSLQSNDGGVEGQKSRRLFAELLRPESALSESADKVAQFLRHFLPRALMDPKLQEWLLNLVPAMRVEVRESLATAYAGLPETDPFKARLAAGFGTLQCSGLPARLGGRRCRSRPGHPKPRRDRRTSVGGPTGGGGQPGALVRHDAARPRCRATRANPRRRELARHVRA
jgi:hypothetical protein